VEPARPRGARARRARGARAARAVRARGALCGAQHAMMTAKPGQYFLEKISRRRTAPAAGPPMLAMQQR